MSDKILKTIIIVVAIIAGAYVIPRIGCSMKFAEPVVQVPDYNNVHQLAERQEKEKQHR